MTSSPPNPTIFTLPSELRIQIYQTLLSSSPITLSLSTLTPCAGLILSCKKISQEFEHEWSKFFTPVLPALLTNTIFTPLPISTFAGARHIRLLFPANTEDALYTPAIEHTLESLALTARSITLQADPSSSFDLPSPDMSIASFKTSSVYAHLKRFAAILTNNYEAREYWAEMADYGHRAEDYETREPEYPEVWEKIVTMDVWKASVTVARRREEVSGHKGSPLWKKLPWDVRRRVWEGIVGRCETVGELEEYSGLVGSCARAGEEFVGVLGWE